MKLSLTIATFFVALVAAGKDDNDMPVPTPTPTPPPGTKPKPDEPCPTTLTVTGPLDCSGCTTTLFDFTATNDVDCNGCDKLTTSTYHPPYAGLCPVCFKGVQTVYNHVDTSTVTSCSPTPPGPPPPPPTPYPPRSSTKL